MVQKHNEHYKFTAKNLVEGFLHITTMKILVGEALLLMCINTLENALIKPAIFSPRLLRCK